MIPDEVQFSTKRLIFSHDANVEKYKKYGSDSLRSMIGF